MAVATSSPAVTGATATTATISANTPAANSRQFAAVCARAGGAAIPTISDSLGGTWTLVPGTDIDSVFLAGALYYQDTGGSPSSRDVTVSSVGATQVAIRLIEVTGADPDLSNLQIDVDTAGDPAITMGAFVGVSSTCIYIGFANAGAAWPQPTSYVEQADTQPATNLRIAWGRDTTADTTAIAITSTATDAILYGIELKEATAGQVITGALFVDADTFENSVFTTGPVAINGTRFDNDNTFFVNDFGGSSQISGNRFDNVNTFNANVIRGLNIINGLRFDNQNTFFANEIDNTQIINGALFANQNQFFANIFDVEGEVDPDTGGGELIIRYRRRGRR